MIYIRRNGADFDDEREVEVIDTSDVRDMDDALIESILVAEAIPGHVLAKTTGLEYFDNFKPIGFLDWLFDNVDDALALEVVPTTLLRRAIATRKAYWAQAIALADDIGLSERLRFLETWVSARERKRFAGPEATIEFLGGAQQRAIVIQGALLSKARAAHALRGTSMAVVLPAPDDRNDDFCRLGGIGDRFWVQEAWAVSKAWDNHAIRDAVPGTLNIWYEDGAMRSMPAARTGSEWSEQGVWRDPSKMPRWASRLICEIDKVDLGPVRSMKTGLLGIEIDELPPRAWDRNDKVWLVQFHVVERNGEPMFAYVGGKR